MQIRLSFVFVGLGLVAALAIGVLVFSGREPRSEAGAPRTSRPARESDLDSWSKPALDTETPGPDFEGRAAVAVADPATSASADGNLLEIEFVEAGTHLPVPGASVAWWPHLPVLDEVESFEAWLQTSTLEDHLESASQARADERGRVRLPSNGFGSFVSASSGDSWGAAFVGADSLGLTRIELARTTDIHVRVLDPNDVPVVGVVVALRRRHGTGHVDRLVARTAGPDGRATLRHAERFLRGRDTSDDGFVVTLRGLVDPVPEQAIDAEHPPVEEVKFVLEPTGSCEVLVVDENGRSVGGALEARLSFADSQLRVPSRPDPAAETIVSRSGERVLFEHVAIGRDITVEVAREGADVTESASGPGPKHAGERVRLLVRVDAHSAIWRGRIVDTNGAPLGPSTVRVSFELRPEGPHFDEAWPVRVGADGRFSLFTRPWPETQAGLALAVYRFTERGTPCAVARRSLPPSGGAGSHELGDFVLVDIPVAVAGTVVGPEGHPVAGALVTPSIPDLVDDGESTQKSVRSPQPSITDSRGRFEIRAEIENTPRDQLAVTAEMGERVSEPLLANIGERELRLVLGAPGTIGGSVLLDSSLATSMMLVHATRMGLEGTRLPVLGEKARVLAPDGRFELRGLRPGTYTIHVVYAANGCEVAAVPSVVARAGESTRDARLDPLDLRGACRLVTLRLLDERGTPVREARAFSRPSGDPEASWTFAGREGDGLQLLFDGRPLDVTISAVGYQRTELERVDASQDVVMRRAAELRFWLARGLSVPAPPVRLEVRVTPVSPATDSQFAHSGWVAFGELGEVTCPTMFVGDLRTSLRLFDEETSKARDLEDNGRDVIHVEARGGEQSFEVRFDPAHLEAGVRALRGDH